LVDNCVTVRDRDTMQQVRVPIDNLRSMIFDELKPKK
jgi:glycyl-tRNA synthetase (class II)